MATKNFLYQDITYLKGVGPARAKLLMSELGIKDVCDLLYTFPYKYIDRTVVHRVADIHEGMPYVQLRGKILSYEMEGTRRKLRLKALFSDGTGCVAFVWFNAFKHIEATHKPGHEYVVLGNPLSITGTSRSPIPR